MDKIVSFSFVMPAFKRQFLQKAIDSILRQDYPNLELIIVNDNSPEDLASIVTSYNDKRIRYSKNQNNIGGKDLVANWNHCIQLAQNEYIILATDDDMFEPDFLSHAVVLINKYPDADLIRSGVRKIDENGKTIDIEFPLKEHMTCREFTLFYAKGGTISCISNYIFKRKALEKNNGFISFPHAHYSDDATALALSVNGVACINSNKFLFRVSKINLSNRTDLQLVLDQLKASELYAEWYLNHISQLNTSPDDFFYRACYGGFKSRYIYMIEKLTDKIHFSNFPQAIKIILTIRYLFKKERIRLILNYFVNKV